MVESNVVRRDSFALQMRVLLDNATTPDTLANRAIKEVFSRWAGRRVYDVTDQLSFTGLQRLLICGVARGGEVLVRHLSGFNNEYGYALQVLDIDHLDTGYSVPPQNGRNAVHVGVELSSYFHPVAYWLRMSHPGEAYGRASTGNLRERAPAEQISHIFLHNRPGQRRGFPWVASAIIGLQNLSGHQEVAIIAARVGASRVGFFKQTEDTDNFMPSTDGREVDNGRDGTDLIGSARPGAFHELSQDYDFTPFDPDYLYANYDAFIKASLRGIASSLNVAYHDLANDLKGVSSSSIRSGTLEERGIWMMLQNWFAESFLYDVFDHWVEAVLLVGAIKMPSDKSLPAGRLDKFKACSRQGRRWSWVDPLKDINAHKGTVALPVKSRHDICTEMGLDFEDIIAQIKHGNRILAAKGVAADAKPPSVAAEPKSGNDPNEENKA